MRPSRLSLFAPLLVALVLLPAPSSALGAANHPFLSPILTEPPLEDACGVALEGGGLYVSDYYHDAIDLPGSGKIADASPSNGPCKLAFDAAGDLYVNDWHGDVVKYDAGDLTSGAGTVIDSADPTGVAVDRATGDVYVVHRTYIAAYDPSGALLSDEIGLGSLQEGYGIAVSEYPSTAGYLYVPDAATHTVKVYDPAGADPTTPVEEIDGVATPQGGFTHLVDSEVAVDNGPTSPSYGHLFVLDNVGYGKSEQPEAVLDEFNAAGAYRGQITGFTDAEPSGVAIEEATGDVYVTSGNSEGSAVFVYGPTAPAHTLTVTKGGSGGGTVTSSPVGISCGTACAAEFDEGQRVTIAAAPDGHSVFSGWTVTGAEPCPGTGTCTVLMGGDVEVSAGFDEPTQETLTVTESGSGDGRLTSEPTGISCPGTCSEHFDQGRVVTLIATPASGDHLAAWDGACAGTSADEACEVTMSEAKTAGAEFARDPATAGLDTAAPPSTAGVAPATTLTLGRASISGAGATLAFDVSGPGTVLVAGRRLESAAPAVVAGENTLHLKLSRPARHTLHRRGRLWAKVRLAFTPSAGGPLVMASRALRFGSTPWRTTKPERHPPAQRR